MTTQTPIHISDRFFAKAGRYFGSLESALNELFQNAYRSYLPLGERQEPPFVYVNVVDYPGSRGYIRIRDGGRGISDIGAALSIGDSRWGDDVEEEQDPAGMGICGILAFCRSVSISSTFGSLEIESERFFGDADYRALLLDQVEDQPFDEGTVVTMWGVQEGGNSWRKPIDIVRTIAYNHVSLDTYVTSSPSTDLDAYDKVETLLEIGDGYRTSHAVHGCWVYDNDAGKGSFGRRNLTVIWHGQRIDVDTSGSEFTRQLLPKVETTPWALDGLVVVVDRPVPGLRPKLPDRDRFIITDGLVDFVWQAVEPRLRRNLSYMRDVARRIRPGKTFRRAELSEMRRGFPSKVWDAVVAEEAPYVIAAQFCSDDHGAERPTDWNYGVYLPEDAPSLLSNKALVFTTNDGENHVVGVHAGVEEHMGWLLFDPAPSSITPEAVRCGPQTGRYRWAFVQVMLPYSSEEFAGETVLLTDEPLKAVIHHMGGADCPFEAEQLSDYDEDDLPELMQDSDKECLELKAVTVDLYCDSTSIDSHIWCGIGKGLASLLDEAVMHRMSDWEMDDREEVETHLGHEARAIRHQLTGFADVASLLEELSKRTGGWLSPRKVTALALDWDKQEGRLTYRDGGEEQVREFRIE